MPTPTVATASTCMLDFRPLRQQPAPPTQMTRLLQHSRDVVADGMASIDEYGDMLKWGLPRKDGMCRYVHVFHPGFCSYEDRFRGTIHYHGGEIRGTILAGQMQHHIYHAVPDPAGDRFLGQEAYRLMRVTHIQDAGTSYVLPARVPHWLKPTELTVTYFEEEDNEEMGDLLEPADVGPDEHPWTQQQVARLQPQILSLLERRLQVPPVAV